MLVNLRAPTPLHPEERPEEHTSCDHTQGEHKPLPQLTTAIGHDLCNMLSVILGFTHIILEDAALDTVTREYLTDVKQAAERSTELAERLRKGGAKSCACASSSRFRRLGRSRVR